MDVIDNEIVDEIDKCVEFEFPSTIQEELAEEHCLSCILNNIQTWIVRSQHVKWILLLYFGDVHIEFQVVKNLLSDDENDLEELFFRFPK